MYQTPQQMNPSFLYAPPGHTLKDTTMSIAPNLSKTGSDSKKLDFNSLASSIPIKNEYACYPVSQPAPAAL